MIKRRKPIPRISKKKLEQLRGNTPFSTIRRQPKKGLPLRVYNDDREVCNLDTVEGKRIYRTRVKTMLYRQKGLCCNCKKTLDFSEATFEHEFGRGLGGSKRDDRIEINGQRINGASHPICNSERGSTRAPIWHGPERPSV